MLERVCQACEINETAPTMWKRNRSEDNTVGLRRPSQPPKDISYGTLALKMLTKCGVPLYILAMREAEDPGLFRRQERWEFLPTRCQPGSGSHHYPLDQHLATTLFAMADTHYPSELTYGKINQLISFVIDSAIKGPPGR